MKTNNLPDDLFSEHLFELTEDYKNFHKGNIMLKTNEPTEDGIEFFDITTEMETGDCYSDYDIPEELLKPASEDKKKIANEFLLNY